MSNPLVSLIMPVFNHEKFIKRSVGSIVDQEYKNWELIVIDDGSTDKSAELVKNFNDQRISYHYQENQGVKNLAKTINRGLDFAKGDFVTMMPSDDSWPSNRLSLQVPLTNKEEVVLSYGCMNLIDEDDKIIGYADPKKITKNTNNNPVGSILDTLLVENFIGEPTVLIKTKELKQIGGYLQPEGMLAEDYPTMLELAKKGEFVFIDHTLANYRFHGSQMTNLHIVDMTQKDREFVTLFFNTLPDSIKAESLWDIDSLDIYWAEKIARSHFSLGRRLSFAKDKNKALEELKKALFLSKKIKLKSASILAIFSVALGFNIEWMRIFSKASVPMNINS